jgi:altronate hydrolase
LLRNRVLRVDPKDNVLIALADLRGGDEVVYEDSRCTLVIDIPAKHKIALRDFTAGDRIVMYGIVVGEAIQPIRCGELITTRNTQHRAAGFARKSEEVHWRPPSVSRWQQRTFLGYSRQDGQVGTRNYWLVVPLVFCENRNIDMLERAFEDELGYGPPQVHRREMAELVRLYREGRWDELNGVRAPQQNDTAQSAPLFENVDGIKFLTHEHGCGGTREDANNICGLLAGYIHHPNVAGATVLSLGCQHSQADILQQELRRRNPNFSKPLIVLEQQRSNSERALLSEAVKQTFFGVIAANQARRSPASLAHLCAGLKCGASDGFSGISANPAIGHLSDLLAALGGRTILAEFPELCGVEQALIDRCTRDEVADRFIHLMRDYAERARAVHSGFDMNPSPGNISDGLITDAMKSAGAAKKGGTSPITAVLDYPEYATEPGLNLLCTPGHDVEAVTAQVAAGANIVLFTTGLGTPTGNPIAPVVKISTNSELARRMPDVIDIDAGSIITGEQSVDRTGESILEFVIKVAGGEIRTKTEQLGQDDFIPWKRGVSL